jgi:hypothetical protein
MGVPDLPGSTGTKEIAMGVTPRVIALSLLTTVLVGGPLAPLARAQPAPARPDLIQESIKATPGETPERVGPTGYEVGAALADLFYVPGKTFLCALGLGVAGAILVVTFGSGYRTAARMGEEGCGGKWLLRGKDLQPAEPTSRAFDWEQDPSR